MAMNRRIRLAIAALVGMLAALLFAGGASTEPAAHTAQTGAIVQSSSPGKLVNSPATGFSEAPVVMAANPRDIGRASTGVQQRATPATTPSRTPQQRATPATTPSRTPQQRGGLAASTQTATSNKASSTASTPTSPPAPAPAEDLVATSTAIIIPIPQPLTSGLPDTGSKSDRAGLGVVLALTLACLLLGLGLALRLASTRRTR
ncbi:MAG TPA: hypothetical protein VF914_05995 [Chloroflexia bacterium]